MCYLEGLDFGSPGVAAISRHPLSSFWGHSSGAIVIFLHRAILAQFYCYVTDGHFAFQPQEEKQKAQILASGNLV